MRKLVFAIVLAAAASLLSSCSMVGSRLAELNRNNKSESELIDGCFEQIIEAIDNYNGLRISDKILHGYR